MATKTCDFCGKEYDTEHFKKVILRQTNTDEESNVVDLEKGPLTVSNVFLKQRILDLCDECLYSFLCNCSYFINVTVEKEP